MLGTHHIADGSAYWGEIIVLLAMGVGCFSEMEQQLASDAETSAANFVEFMGYMRKALIAADVAPKGWLPVRRALQSAIRPVIDFSEASLKFQFGTSKSDPIGTDRKHAKAQSALSAFPVKMERARSIAARLQRAAGGSRAQIISLSDAVSLSQIPTE